MTADVSQPRKVVGFRRPLKALAVALPLAVLATAAPIVRQPTKPDIRHSVVTLDEAGRARAPADFALVGVAWPKSSVRPSEVLVRASRDAGTWSSWQELDIDIDNGPDRGTEGSDVVATKPLWVGRARHAEVRFEGARPKGASLRVVDPGPDPVPALPSAAASPGKPGMITRSQWGADESIRKGTPDYAEPIRLAVVHHTATGDSYAASESDNLMRSIYSYHVNTNGWNDIGYNFVVDRYGQIFEGRYGGTERTVVGAHAMGFNSNSTGIAILGSFDGSKPPEAAMQSLKRIVAYKLDLGWVNPEGSLTYVSNGSSKYPAGQSVSLKAVSGHLDVGQTACPGQPLYNALSWVRDAAEADGDPKLFDAKLSRPVITPNDAGPDGLRLTGRFSQTVEWTAEVINYAGTVMHKVSGNGATLNAPWYGKNTQGQIVTHDDYRFRVTAKNSTGKIRTAYLPFEVWRYPDGTFFLTQSGTTYILDGGKLRHPSSWQSRATRYSSAEAVLISDHLKKVYPIGSNIGFRTGSITKVGSKLYFISEGKKRPTSSTTLSNLGYNVSAAVIETSSTAMAPHPAGSTLTSSGYPNSAVLRSSDLREAWVSGGIARPFVTPNIRRSYMIRDVDRAGPADDKILTDWMSSPWKFREGTLMRRAEGTTIYVSSNGYRRPISSSRTFSQMGYKSSNIKTVTDAELAVHAEGPPI